MAPPPAPSISTHDLSASARVLPPVVDHLQHTITLRDYNALLDAAMRFAWLGWWLQRAPFIGETVALFLRRAERRGDGRATRDVLEVAGLLPLSCGCAGCGR
jgi:hypothetical protein